MTAGGEFVRKTVISQTLQELGSLATGRAIGLLTYGYSEYNIGAIAYESVAAAVAFYALKRRDAAAPEARPETA